MKCGVFLWGFFAFFCFFLPAALRGEEAGEKTAEDPFFTWNLLWTGSWQNKPDFTNGFESREIFEDGTLQNRGDLSLGLPRQYLTLRFQATDKRKIPRDGLDGGSFNPGFGLYFDGGPWENFPLNGRFLRGVLAEQGLSARITNVWAKSAPYTENRKAVSGDLKTEASARNPETYAYIGFPRLGPLSFYASAKADDTLNPAFGGGIEARPGTIVLRTDVFYTRRELAPETAASWFSAQPPLPERETELWSGGMVFNTVNFGLASDWAYSETFAFGRGYYGNASLRAGNKPWKFSIAGDIGSENYVDPDGASHGGGWRLSGRVERRFQRAGLFSLEAKFRSPAIGESFDRGAFSAYFRLPAAPRRNRPVFRLNRVSAGLSRNASNPEKTLDGAEALAVFSAGPFTVALSCSIDSISDSISVFQGNVIPLPLPPSFQSFNAGKVSGEGSWSRGSFSIKFKTGRCFFAEKPAFWDISAGVSIKPFRGSQFGLKIASPEFPGKWEYSISWKLERR
jgi:hypothetical protein